MQGKLQQLWLDHLLALATARTDGLETALFVVIYPTINECCAEALGQYRDALSPAGRHTFEARTLEDAVEPIGAAIGDEWRSAFVARYLTPSNL